MNRINESKCSMRVFDASIFRLFTYQTLDRRFSFIPTVTEEVPLLWRFVIATEIQWKTCLLQHLIFFMKTCRQQQFMSRGARVIYERSHILYYIRACENTKKKTST